MSDIPTEVQILATPIGFATVTLKQVLYPWQQRALTWFEFTERLKAALCTPNGAGKSAVVIASLVLWWLAMHKRGRVVVTTKDSRQLDNQIYPAIGRHRGKFEGWKFIDRQIDTPTGGRVVFFTTDEAGRAEGWHKGFLPDGTSDPDEPLLIIVDEAKSVPEPIFQAIDRCTYTALFYVSSPGEKNGRFYDAMTKAAMGFRTMKVGLADCPHIPIERIRDIEAMYGKDHPFTLSTLYGEFMDDDGNLYAISPTSVRQLYESPPAPMDGHQYAFCDFAGGGDECVLARRVGNRIPPLDAWKDPNTMATLGRFISLFVKYGLRPHEIYGDESGLGGPMIDRLAEMGWPINRVNNGARAHNPERYKNRGAEQWGDAAITIANFGCILPEDDKLKAQLTSRQCSYNSAGQMELESKPDMKKRGLNSPDRGDAVVGVLSIETALQASEFERQGIERLQDKSTAAKPLHGILTEGISISNFSEVPDGYLTLWEAPTVGRGYIATLKAGEDGWSFFVLRSPYKNEDGKPVNARLVARLRPPCDWDGDRLVTTVMPILKWYGHCPIVPDTRQGADAMVRLREASASIILRPVIDRLNPGKIETALGWETNAKTADVAIGALAKAIREQEVDIECPIAVKDIRHFKRDNLENGDTLALGIGMACLDLANIYRLPKARASFRQRQEANKMGAACT